MTIITPSPAPFGRWLKQLRSRQDLTQEALAELVACSVQTICFFETGKRRPGLAMAERLADVLQVPADERETFIRQARTPLGSEPAADHTPAPAEAVLPHRHLPVPPSSLIGRAAEINVLGQLFLQDRCRLVTVLGVGGMGKTRLALATALASHFTLYHTIDHPDELGWAMAILCYVLRAQGQPQTTQELAVATIQTVLTAQGFNAVASLLPILALLLFDQGQTELAAAITRALRQNAFVQQSVWFAQVAGDELQQWSATLPPHTQAAMAAQVATDPISDQQALLSQIVRAMTTP